MFCDLTYDLSWRMFCVHLRRMCIQLLLDGMFCICLLRSLVNCNSGPVFLCWFVNWMTCWKWGIEIPYCYCMYSCLISPLRSVSICLIYLSSPICVHTYLQLLYPLDELTPLLLHNDLLCLLLVFDLKPVLSDISMTTLSFGFLLHWLSFSMSSLWVCVSLKLKWVFCWLSILAFVCLFPKNLFSHSMPFEWRT